jgi:O-antigen ligase
VLFVVTFPFLESYSNSVSPVGTRALGLLVAASWIVSVAMNPSVVVAKVSLWVAAFGVWLLATSWWAVTSAEPGTAVVEYALASILYFMIVDLVRSMGALRWILGGYVFGVALLLPSAVTSVLSGPGSSVFYDRFTAQGADPNNFGVMLVVAVAAATAFLRRGSIASVLAGLFCAVAVPLALATGSRTMLVALVSVVGGYTLLEMRRARWARVALGFMIALLALRLVSSLVPMVAVERLTDPQALSDVGGRLDIWSDGWTAFTQAPILGQGAGAFPVLVGYDPHNSFLGTAVELGAIGLALWIGMWFGHLRSAFRAGHATDRPEIRAVILGLTAVLVANLALNWQVRKPTYLFLGLAACTPWLALRERRAADSGASS